jgi:separase
VKPDAALVAAAVEAHALFVYFGHGGGEKFLPAKQLWQREKCATTLLIG